MNKKLKSSICLMMAGVFVFAGCGGRNANPMLVYLPGDESRSCTGYLAEIAQLDADMARILPKTSKAGYNTLMGIAGAFVIVPWFFIDVKNADKIEWEAMRVRRNRLLIYAAEKGCDFGATGKPAVIPSIKELKKMQKEQAKQRPVTKD